MTSPSKVILLKDISDKMVEDLNIAASGKIRFVLAEQEILQYAVRVSKGTQNLAVLGRHLGVTGDVYELLASELLRLAIVDARAKEYNDALLQEYNKLIDRMMVYGSGHGDFGVRIPPDVYPDQDTRQLRRKKQRQAAKGQV